MRIAHVLLAPDSFKGTLTAAACAEAMAEGVQAALPGAACTLLPLSDGGEGLVEVLTAALGGERLHDSVAGPLPGQTVTASWGYAAEHRIAVIELAEAAGLTRVPVTLRDPRRTTTYGVGELIGKALDRGASTIIVGIGGSATNDGGAGMAEALGARFLDRKGEPLPRGGGALLNLATIDMTDLDPRLRETTVIAACDVENPLVGATGAAAVYAPQKGAAAADVALLDIALRRFADVVAETTGADIRAVPGAGAAGGTGGGLLVFCNALLRKGIEVVLEALEFDARLAEADLVITGEGKLDAQTLAGKVVSGVIAHAARAAKPVAIVAGEMEGRRDAFLHQGTVAAIATLMDETTPQGLAMRRAAELVRERTRTLVTALASGSAG